MLISAVGMAAIALLTVAGAAQAATSTVCSSGCDHATIQAAVNAATAGDTISVGAGTYTDIVDNYAHVAVNTPNLKILGAQYGVDARTRSATGESIVQAGGTNRQPAFFINADGVVIDGFTLQGGTNAAGITIAKQYSGSQILNNVIQNNSIGLFPASNGATQTIVKQNFFKNNNVPGASSGTGIYSDDGLSNALIDNNKFTGHSSAAMNLIGLQSFTVSNNQLVADASIVLFNSMTGSIANNISTAPQGSGLFLGGGNNGVDVTGNTISGGVSSAVNVQDVGYGPNTSISVLGNTLTENGYGIRVNAGALATPLEAHFNRIVGNTTAGLHNNSTSQVNAENNWWGCNDGPNTVDCDAVSGTGPVDFDPWLVLGISASPDSVTTEGDSTITADLTRNSADTDTSGSGMLPNGTPVDFSTDLGSVNPSDTETTGGKATTTFTAGTNPGTANTSAIVDGQSVSVPVTVEEPPDQTAPRVSRVEPRENATGVGPGTSVRAFFSEAMRADSINTTTVKIFKAGEDRARKATVTYDGATDKATLDPSAELRRGDSYRVVVNRGARDEAGNRLDQNQDPSNGNQKKVWRFTVMN